MYLAGPGKIAQELGIAKAKAKQYIDAYFEEAKDLKKWLSAQVDFVKKYGYVKSIFGRIRRVPEVYSTNQYISEHAVKSAVNFLIQSPTNDLNLIAFCNAMKKVRESGLEFYPFTLVHDSVVAEIPNIPVGEEFLRIFREEIAKVFPDAFSVIGVDAEVGDTWADLKTKIN
jgi:DNA polymerase-1